MFGATNVMHLLEEACVARSSHTYSFCNNTSRSNQNMRARRFNYSTVVLISGNENQQLTNLNENFYFVQEMPLQQLSLSSSVLCHQT